MMMKNQSIYLLRFAISATKSLLRKQHLQLPTQPTTYSARFLLTEKNYEEWRSLFSVGTVDGLIPFDYYWPHFTMFFLQVINKLQINYRNILHLGHEVLFLRDSHGIRIGEEVQIHMVVKDIALLDHNRAVVIIESTITDTAASKIGTCIDTIFVKNLSVDNVALLKNTHHYNHTDTSDFLNLSKHQATLTGRAVQSNSFYIPDHFGMKYAKVSGDYNPIHIQPWLAKLFGYSQAFVQGSAITNFLTKLFIGDLNEKLQFLTIKFCRPVHLGQTITVHFSATAFELISSEGQLVAFGKRG